MTICVLVCALAVLTVLDEVVLLEDLQHLGAYEARLDEERRSRCELGTLLLVEALNVLQEAREGSLLEGLLEELVATCVYAGVGGVSRCVVLIAALCCTHE